MLPKLNNFKQLLPYVGVAGLLLGIISFISSKSANRTLKEEIKTLRLDNKALRKANEDINSGVHQISTHLEENKIREEQATKQEADEKARALEAVEAAEREKIVKRFRQSESPAVEGFIDLAKEERTVDLKKKSSGKEVKTFSVLPISYNIGETVSKEIDVSKEDEEKAYHLKRWTANKKQ